MTAAVNTRVRGPHPSRPNPWYFWAAITVLLGLQLATWVFGSPFARAEPSHGPAAPPSWLERLQQLETRVDTLTRSVAERPQSASPVRSVAAEELGAILTRLDAMEQKLGTDDSSPTKSGPTGTELRALIGQLNAALASNNHAEAERLLAMGLDLDARDEDRQTPLGAAAVAGRLSEIETLLGRGARIDRTGQRGMTPVLAALDADQEEAALLLLERGANPNAVDKNGEGVLIWAAFNGLERVIERTLRLGTTINHQAHDGATALMDAARRGHQRIVQQLLNAGADLHLSDKSGRTALQHAVAAGHGTIADLLRQHGGR